jgi:hypothetical protein
MNHEGVYIGIRSAGRRRRHWLFDLAAFTKKAGQHMNRAGFLWKLLPKPLMTCIQVLFGEIPNPADRSSFEVLSGATRHAQLVPGRSPRVLLIVKPAGIAIHERPQHWQ